MRKAPPTVPGTPMRPSIPPRLFFAQKVTVRPRSAAASTRAKSPSRTTSWPDLASCNTTQGNSPSATSRFVPPPRRRCGMACRSSRLSSSGKCVCSWTRSKSVVPPMPSEVCSASGAPGHSSTPRSGSAATTLGSLIRIVRRHLGPQKNCELSQRAADVARTNRQDGVAGTRFAEQVFDAFLHGAAEDHVLVAGGADGIREGLAGDPRNRRLAGRVDIGQHEHVGLVECAAKLIPEKFGARIAMRLEKNQQPVELATPCGVERRANLRGVVAIIVNQRDAVDGALDVEAAAHAGEFTKALTNQVGRNIQVEGDRRGGSGIANVVDSRRRRQVEFSEIVAAVGEAKLALETLQLNIADNQISLARRPVGDDGPLHVGNDGLHIGLIETQNGCAVKRHTIHKLRKRVLNFLERPVLVEVLAVNGRNHCDHRREQEKRTVALVGLDDHVFAFAQPRSGSRLIDAPTHDESRVQMRRRKDRSHQRSRGGLAMRARHRDSVFQAHQFREHFGARDYRDLALVRFDDFRVVRFHRGGNDHHVRALHLLGAVPFEDGGAEISQPRGYARRLQVRSGNGITQCEKNFGDAAHADAADAHQMNALKIAKGNHHGRATSSIKLTISRAALGRARLRARAESSTICAGRSSSEKISPARRCGVNSVSAMRRPAPARTITCALRSWWLSVEAPKGMKMAARPAAAISAVVMAPARQTIRSVWAKRSGIFVRKGTTCALISLRA